MNAVVSECTMTKTCDNLEIKIAETDVEIEQALRLRYKVFVEEEGNGRMSCGSGLERDRFDDYCDHLIVTSERMGSVVGTYRLLPGARAEKGIGFYSETEFDLQKLTFAKSCTLELGRSCIHPDYRNGRVIQLLWEGIASYCREFGYSHLIGCASMRLKTLCELNEIYSFLLWKQVITARYGTCPLPSHRINGLQWLEFEGSELDIMRKLPPLLKGYQWLGAQISGEPAYDELFNTIDFLIVLETGNVTRKYNKHFLSPHR